MSEGVPWLPLSFGSQESNFPSSCLNFMEHMKNTRRQKSTSTIGTTLIATGLSAASPPPAMIVPPEFLALRSVRSAQGEFDVVDSKLLADVHDVDHVLPGDAALRIDDHRSIGPAPRNEVLMPTLDQGLEFDVVGNSALAEFSPDHPESRVPEQRDPDLRRLVDAFGGPPVLPGAGTELPLDLLELHGAQ